MITLANIVGKSKILIPILCSFILLLNTLGIAKTILVPAGDAAAFQTALNTVAPGDTIKLAAGNYLGSFYTKINGTADAPIWIIGTNNSILRDAPNDPNLNIFNDYYRVENLTLVNGRRAIYAEKANHGIVRNCVGKNSYKGTFKLQQQCQYWLFENCRAEGPQSLGPGEGFYVSKAKSDWDISGSTIIPDNSGYITFLNCTAFNCIDDGFDIKESGHHIKIINCTVDFNNSAITGDNSKTGIFSRANNLQVINFLVKNNPQNSKPSEEAYGMYANTMLINSVSYGNGMELYGFSANNIYEPMFFFESTATNSVKLYTNYSMTNVSKGMYKAGSVQPAPLNPATFNEMTWVGEGGDTYANLTTSVNYFSNESSIPNSFSLEQNYPNPFNPSTTISFSIPTTCFVSLKIFDVLGREVTTLISDTMLKGHHIVTWNAKDIPSGIYVYQMSSPSSIETKKCMLIK